MAYKKMFNLVKLGVELKMNWLNGSIPISSGFQFQFNSNSKSLNSNPIQFMLNWIELIINSNSIHELIRALLLERLKSGLGICGTALNWFKSYLSGRSQSVLINGTQSKPTSLVCGVPQGSVLGPILFTIYMLPLGDIIKRHGMQFHMYADDCQLYTTFEASDINQTALNMEILIDDIRGWYSENMLKLNDSKTEMMVISSKFRPSVHLDHIKIGESSISPSETVRNLGVIMDSNYTMVSHINHKVQESFLKIRELSYYRRYLTDESSKTAVHAYVTSRLDYCNSLLYGLPKELSKKLQSVMNTAARLVTRTRKFDHITPVLQDLHWLPIESRSKFKILLLVYKCLYGLAPSYLSKRLSLKPNRGLRSDAGFEIKGSGGAKCSQIEPKCS